jgi:hypothetical protein
MPWLKYKPFCDRYSSVPVIGLFIQSYQRRDGAPGGRVSIKEVEDDVMTRLKMSVEAGGVEFCGKKVISEKANQKRFETTEISESRDVIKGNKMEKFRVVYLLHEKGNIVHCVQLSIRDDLYLLPESQVIMQEILDSFSVNSL